MTLELKSVRKTVGADVHIHETSLKLEEGTFNILLGTTLAGKTTLMLLMAGLERPSAGEVWFRGRDVTGVAVQKRNVSMVYQQFINYPNFTVFENIASPLKVARVAQAQEPLEVGIVRVLRPYQVERRALALLEPSDDAQFRFGDLGFVNRLEVPDDVVLRTQKRARPVTDDERRPTLLGEPGGESLFRAQHL